MKSPCLFDTYEDFIRSLAGTMKEHPNSKVPVWRILDSRQYLPRHEWEEARREYTDIEEILDESSTHTVA